MPKLMRDPVKYIRDKAKSRYEKGSECYICSSTDTLDFHHYFSLSPLLNKWLQKNDKPLEYIMAWREDFIEEHLVEIYDETVTLCHTHHLRLHSIYGKDPALHTAKKQKNWVQIQRDKNGLV